MTGRILMMGIGNFERGDDAAGLEVIRRLKAFGLQSCDFSVTDGEPSKLMDLWEAYDHVIAIDAVFTGANPAGTIYRWDVIADRLPADCSYTSSHALGLADAIELARVLRRLPKIMEVVGIEAEEYEVSRVISEPVRCSIEDLVKQLRQELTDA